MESIIEELVREWEDRGRAKGHADACVDEARRLLYRVLLVRRFVTTPNVRSRINKEVELARLEAWHDAAVTVSALDDVFLDD